jgi:DNA polymerase I-like protein with 3'-5' exonuclease and polymerase domains
MGSGRGAMKVRALYDLANIRGIDDAVIAMERAGFMLDVPYLETNLALAKADEAGILASLATDMAEAGVPPLPGWENIWTSTPQLIQLLHGDNGLRLAPSPVKFKGKVKLDEGERSTDKAAMDWLRGRAPGDRPAVARVLDGIIRLRNTRSCAKYLAKLPRYVGADGFVHPVCGPAGDNDDRVGAITGRFGMKNPEGQQIPKNKKKDPYRIRRAFIAPPGMSLIAADYSALEVVILANISEFLFGDTLLLDLTGPGQDVHAYNAHRIFGELLGWKTAGGRVLKDFTDVSDGGPWKTNPDLAWFRDLIKAVWYGLMYGKTGYGFGFSLKDQAGEMLGQTRADEIVSALYEACPPIQKWHRWVERVVPEVGGITGPDGRAVDYSPMIQRGEWGVKAACRAGDNFPMQEFGAYVVGMAMTAINKCEILKKVSNVMQMQIHDEIVSRCPDRWTEEAAEIMKYHMETAAGLKNLRVEVGVAKCWEDA